MHPFTQAAHANRPAEHAHPLAHGAREPAPLRRLPNGNTIIGYSTKGAVQEVDKDGNVLTDWTFPLGGQFGYIEKRATLYGPPPR